MRPRTSPFHAFISSFSRNQSSSSWFEVYAAFSTSMILLRTAVNDFIPPVVRSFLISKFKSLFKYSSSRFISLQINEFWDTMQSNQLYVAAKEYMATKVRHHYNVLQIGQLPGKNKVAFSVTSGQKLHDVFDDMKITWTFVSSSLPQPQSQPQLQNNYHVSNQVVSDEKNMYVLSFDEKYREKVLENYIPHVLKMNMNVKEGERVLKIHSLKSPYAGGNSRSWIQRELRHPATFKTLAMEPELKNSIIEDLDRFLKRKEFYNKVGKAWKRGYLLYGPPGTGKSSLIGAMANYLKFDVYDLQLSSIGCDSQLMSAVRTTSNRSILVIEDIDCNEETQKRSTQVEDQMLQFSKKSVKFTLSGLLNYIDGLKLRNSLCCSYGEDDHKPAHQSWRISSGALSAAMSPRDNYASLRRENRELKLELARLRMRLNDFEKEHVCMKRTMAKSGSRKFMSSFSKKIGKLSFFAHSSSRGSSSPSRYSHRTDSKVIERTCASTE
ncbi:AAA-ATPase [Quillaja saponaria]|uniref:AAA-ATPase n=1 Tax=Quillaja saponaria TaxID=32244 RepID=A0AAD7PCV4_QUISA|nr:AAA-ATPase [Quillaja saponaria]